MITFEEFLQKYGTDTTTNFQLIRWAKELNIKPFYYCMRDEISSLKNKTKFYAITNIHTSDQKGVHHSALFKGDSMYFFDSYGLDPTKEIIDLNYGPIKCSTFQIQKPGDKFCGQLSLWVLYQLSLGKPFEQIVLNLV